MKEQDYEHENQNNHQDQFESKEKDSIKLQKEISRLRDHLKDLDDQLVEEYHKNEELNNQLNRSVNHLDCQSAIENLQQALFQLQNNTDNEINLQLGKYKMNLQNSLNDIKNLTTEINIQKSEIEKLTIENNSIKKKNFELQSQLITSNDFIDKRLIINLLISLFGRDQSKAGSGREILKILASLLQLSDNEKHQIGIECASTSKLPSTISPIQTSFPLSSSSSLKSPISNLNSIDTKIHPFNSNDNELEIEKTIDNSNSSLQNNSIINSNQPEIDKEKDLNNRKFDSKKSHNPPPLHFSSSNHDNLSDLWISFLMNQSDKQ